MEAIKSPFLSKTLWLNAIAGLSALLFPVVGEYISANPTLITTAWTVINLVLRLITKDKLTLY